jgi:hypothetical protein
MTQINNLTIDMLNVVPVVTVNQGSVTVTHGEAIPNAV